MQHLLAVHVRGQRLVVLRPLPEVSITAPSNHEALILHVKHLARTLALTLQVLNELIQCVIGGGQFRGGLSLWLLLLGWRDYFDLRLLELGLEHDRVAEVQEGRVVHRLHDQLRRV